VLLQLLQKLLERKDGENDAPCRAFGLKEGGREGGREEGAKMDVR